MSEELLPQLYPSEYDNLLSAGVTGINDSTFGWCSAINNAGTVFAIGANRKVFVYTSNKVTKDRQNKKWKNDAHIQQLFLFYK